MPSDQTANDPAKWWIDQSKVDQKTPRKEATASYGAHFYRSAEGYEQERARSGLTDLNRKLLAEANPSENELAYLNLIDERSPEKRLERIRRAVPLPEGARAVLVDAGKMARVIVTGSPIGERILEFNFNRGEPTFDAWIRDEWKEEILFDDLNELYREAPKLIERYFSPEALAEPEFLT